MIWTGALIVFIVQLVCCIYVGNRFLKYLPTLLAAGFTAVAFFGNWSVATVLWLMMFGSVLLAGLFAIALYHLAR